MNRFVLTAAVAALALAPSLGIARADDGAPAPTSNVADEPGFLGVYLLANPEGKGALVDGAFEGSPAAKAGLAQGDVITAVDGKAVADLDGLVAILRASKVGQKLTLRVAREGWERDLSVTLGARPDSTQPAAKPETPAPAGKQKGFVGIAFDEGNTDKLIIAEVIAGSGAEKAGLKAGDVVLGIGGKPAKNLDAFVAGLQGKMAGDKIELSVERDGWGRDLTVTLTPRRD